MLFDLINSKLVAGKTKFNFYPRAAAGSYLENDNKLHTRAETKIIFRY